MIRPYLQLAARVLRSNVRRLPFPYKLTFAVTYRCNARCSTCNIWQKKPENELSTDEVQRFFARSNRFSWIDLTGGEPSLRKDFVELCRAVVQNNRSLLLLHFPTNGLLTEKIVRDVREVRALGRSFRIVITVSLDGDEALHDQIRGVKGSWQKALDTFARLREFEGVETVLGMTLTPLNYDRFESTLASVQGVRPGTRADDFHLSLVNYSDMYYDNMDLKKRFSDAETRKVVTEGLIRSVEAYCRLTAPPTHPRAILERAFLRHARSFLRTGRTPLPCHALRSSCFVDPTGEVYPCITFNRSLGNLRDHGYDLSRLWNSEQAVVLQKKIWSLECPQCWTGCDGYQTIMGNLFRRAR